MFKFLKDKLKGAVDKFKDAVSKDEVQEVAPERVPEELKEPEPVEEPVELPAEKEVKKEQETEEEEETVEKEEADSEEDEKTDTLEEETEELDELEEKAQEVVIDEEELEDAVSHVAEELEDVDPEEEERKEEQERQKREAEHERKQAQEKARTQAEQAAQEKTTEEKKKGFLGGIFKKKEAEKPAEQSKKEEPAEKKGFFTKVSEQFTTIQLSEEKFEELFWDLELGLLENNVAISVIEKIKEDLKQELTTGRTARGNLEERIIRRLEESLREVLNIKPIDLLALTKQHKPLIIAAVGINGSGKTTTLAKITQYFQNNAKSVVLAAADTFRAAAIQQLEEHAKKLKVPIIKQDYGADPAAVAFDAIKHAEAKGHAVVLIDTAGRLHSNTNLMDELAKVMRVAKPHVVLFIGEATTGNDCVEQAQQFGKMTRIDGIVLTKADVDEKGGAAISISHVTGKPIVFLGTGQSYNDLEKFDADKILKNVLPQ